MLRTGQVHVGESLGVRRGLLTGVGVDQLGGGDWGHGGHGVARGEAGGGDVGDIAGLVSCVRLLAVGWLQTVLQSWLILSH